MEGILDDEINLMKKLFEDRNLKEENRKIEPIDFIDKDKLSKQEKDELDKLGNEIIKNGQYAVITMAGGQGTRLGFDGPKGTFKLDIGENGKYIFEILVDTLKRAKEKYGVEVNWYIMTSEENNDDTVKFFEEHNYFGYNKEKVNFFKQGSLPLLTKDGDFVIENNKVKRASNGNGSVFTSLKKSGMLDDMKSKNIKWVYICGVDNIMVNMVDNTFLGLAIKNNVISASKSIRKLYPEEKVGIYCKKDGKPSIIEYIDMTEDMIYAKNQDGELMYGESNIVSHLFKIEALEKITNYNLKYHCACKNNMYKFEAFVFDCFEFLGSMAIMRVKREEEFAPVKNAEGNDSPKTAKEIYERYWNEI